MNAIARNLSAEISSAEDILTRPSPNDQTFRAMLVELFHSEQAQTAIRNWLPTARQQVDELSKQIASLEQQVNELKAGPVIDVENVASPVNGLT